MWLLEELRLVRPRLVIALGTSAARGLLGRTVTLSALRGRAIPLRQGGHGWVTIHPSYLLRIEDESARHAEYGRFVHELAAAKSWMDCSSSP